MYLYEFLVLRVFTFPDMVLTVPLLLGEVIERLSSSCQWYSFLFDFHVCRTSRMSPLDFVCATQLLGDDVLV